MYTGRVAGTQEELDSIHVREVRDLVWNRKKYVENLAAIRNEEDNNDMMEEDVPLYDTNEFGMSIKREVKTSDMAVNGSSIQKNYHDEINIEEENETQQLQQGLSSKGYTTLCVVCCSAPSVNPQTGDILALSCHEGHAMCLSCSKSVVVVQSATIPFSVSQTSTPPYEFCPAASTGKVEGPGICVQNTMSCYFKCIECKNQLFLRNEHVMALIRGWGNFNSDGC